MKIKALLTLSFVPPEDVAASFDELIEQFPVELNGLSDYWEDCYIRRKRKNLRGDPRFSIAVCNVYLRVAEGLPRTNNSVEAWHRAFQQTIDCHHPTIFKLLDQFRKEQDHVEIQLERFNAGIQQPEASKNK